MRLNVQETLWKTSVRENEVGSRKSWEKRQSMCRSDSSERDRMEGRVVRWKHLGWSAVLRKVQEGHWGKILCQRDMTFPRIGCLTIPVAPIREQSMGGWPQRRCRKGLPNIAAGAIGGACLLQPETWEARSCTHHIKWLIQTLTSCLYVYILSATKRDLRNFTLMPSHPPKIPSNKEINH